MKNKSNPVTELQITPEERQRLQRQINREFGGRGAQLRKAASLYSKFTGHDDVDAVKVMIPDMPKVVVEIGTCDAIEYTTVRDGKTERYRHVFKKNSRPLFSVSPDGKQILLLGGAFTFAERGIEDH